MDKKATSAIETPTKVYHTTERKTYHGTSLSPLFLANNGASAQQGGTVCVVTLHEMEAEQVARAREKSLLVICVVRDDSRPKDRGGKHNKHLRAAKASSVAAVALGTRSLALPRASNCLSAACAMLLAPLLTALACAVTADAFRFVCSTKSCVFSTCGHPCGATRTTVKTETWPIESHAAYKFIC